MSRKMFKTIAKVFVVLIVLTTLSSCSQKGYGCPYEFKAPSISKILTK